MKYVLVFLSLFFSTQLIAQEYAYDVSEAHPFGRPHPDAPKELLDYELLIGECECESITRNQDQTWAKPETMIWRYKYIMNGTAVQDETLKPDGSHSGSIRQYIADSSNWYVHYYSNKAPTTRLSTWKGGKRGDSIVLYNKQKAPNGVAGFFRITFSNITKEGFNWLGEWVNTTETFIYPTWKIRCRKVRTN